MQALIFMSLLFSISEAIILNMSREKKLYIIRHGTTEMNEALGRQPWGSKSFTDQLLWDTGSNTPTSLLFSRFPPSYSTQPILI